MTMVGQQLAVRDEAGNEHVAEIVAWRELRGHVDFEVTLDGHRFGWESCVFGANRENALAWALEQINAYEETGGFAIACRRCPEQGEPDPVQLAAAESEVSDGADR